MWSPQSASMRLPSSGAAAVAAPGCRKGMPKGASGGNQLRPIRGMQMENWVTSLSKVLSFMSRMRRPLSAG